MPSLGCRILLVFCATVLLGCDAIAWKQEVETVPKMFRDQAMDLLQKGATIQAATSQGVDGESFGTSLISFKASYDLAKGLWPPSAPTHIAHITQTSFDRAIVAWDIVVQHLNKNDGSEKIYEGTKEWRVIASLTDNGQGMKVETEDYPETLKGMRYIWLDKKLTGRLLAVAGVHFEAGKIELLKWLSQSGS